MHTFIQTSIVVFILFVTSLSLLSAVHANTLNFSGMISSPGCVSSLRMSRITLACEDHPATPDKITLRNLDEKKTRVEGVLINIETLSDDRLKKIVSLDYL